MMGIEGGKKKSGHRRDKRTPKEECGSNEQCQDSSLMSLAPT